MLLAMDTATSVVTVALHDGAQVVASLTRPGAMRHGELLAPGIATVLDQAGVARQDVTAVAVGVGPGPFTGLRVGLVTARTLALALAVPVYGVCTLDVLAAQAVDEHAVDADFLVATDARRKEVYWASYDADGTRVDGPRVSRPGDVPVGPDRGVPVVGVGARLYPEVLVRAAGPEHPDARMLAEVVTQERAELLDPEPMYLRRPDVMTPRPRKPVS